MEMYSVNGSIRVDPGQVTDEVMDDLESELDKDNVETHVEGDQLHILVNDVMSYAEADEVDGILKRFAAKYALEPSVLDTEMGGGGIQELFVGPEGFDAAAAEILSLNEKIVALEVRRDELKASRTTPGTVTIGLQIGGRPSIIQIDVSGDGGAAISSELVDLLSDGTPDVKAKVAADAIESLLLAMAAEGINMEDARIARAIGTAIESIGNNMDASEPE